MGEATGQSGVLAAGVPLGGAILNLAERRWSCIVAAVSLLLGIVFSGACAPLPEPLAAPNSGQAARGGPSEHWPSPIIGDPAAVEWASQTGSPRWATDEPWRLPDCIAYERPLARVAAAVAAARARADEVIDLKDVVALLRASGSPHVWPRVWMLEASALGDEQLALEWSRWVTREPRVGERRCGVARVDADAHSVVVAVVVDALADLAPLPLRARVGQWLRFDAHLLAAARTGQLLVMGPDDAPRRVPGRLDVDAFHATFSLDQPGFWRLQLLLDAGFGPQPALEAWVFVDSEPDLEAALRSAPSDVAEPSARATPDQLRGALGAMIDGVRRAQGLPPLRRDVRLDEVAQAHAMAMLQSGRTAHDAGDGMPIDRVARAGMLPRRVGENVARARALTRAHQVLWDSPSHRGNLLDAGFDGIGIGVARSDAGELWVCELFAEYSDRPPILPPARSASSASSAPASRSSSGIWSRPPDAPYAGDPTLGRSLRR